MLDGNADRFRGSKTFVAPPVLDKRTLIRRRLSNTGGFASTLTRVGLFSHVIGSYGEEMARRCISRAIRQNFIAEFAVQSSRRSKTADSRTDSPPVHAVGRFSVRVTVSEPTAPQILARAAQILPQSVANCPESPTGKE